MVVERFSVYLVALDPTVGSEVAKKRPCVVVSPDEMHQNIRTVIIAPMTSERKRYPTRVPCRFAGKSGEIMLDQIRTVDQSRLIKRVGMLDAAASRSTREGLIEMFR